MTREGISCSFRDINEFTGKLMQQVALLDPSKKLHEDLRNVSDKAKIKCLLEVVNEMGVPVEVVMGQEFYRGRKIDRK